MFLPARDAFSPEVRQNFRLNRRPEERVQVLGGAMDLVRPEEVFHFVAGKIAARESAVVANHNLHSLYLIRKDEKIAEFFRTSDLIEVDSVPVIFWARIVGRVRDLLPMETVHKDMVLQRLHETLSAVVQGTLITAAAQGALAGVGFALLDVPFAVFLGCAAAFASLLPFGAPIVWGIVAIYLGFTASLAKTIALIIWGTLVVGTIDNFIRPMLIGGSTEIPTILLFFGILGKVVSLSAR